MNASDRLSRRALFGMVSGRKRGREAAGGVSGLDPLAVRADRLFSQGQYLEAEALYAELIEREPGHQAALHRRGLCLMRLDRHSAARAAWDQLLTLNPDDPAALLHQGLSYAIEGSVDEAVTVWRRYRNYHRIELQRELNLILALADDGRLPAAEELVERVEAALSGDSG